jgi:hypothetical protein
MSTAKQDGPPMAAAPPRPPFEIPGAEPGEEPAAPAKSTVAPADSPEAPKPVAPGPAETRLRIEFDPDAGRFVQYGVDPDTGRVIRQIPTEEALRRITWLRDVQEAKVDARA